MGAQKVAHRAGNIAIGIDHHHAREGLHIISLGSRNGVSKGRPGGLSDLGYGDRNHNGDKLTYQMYQFQAGIDSALGIKCRAFLFPIKSRLP